MGSNDSITARLGWSVEDVRNAVARDGFGSSSAPSLTTKEAAAQIRKALKAHGWNARQVSVRIDCYSLGSSIYVTIKDASIPLDVVRSIAEPFERVHRDSTGEILGGGNRYLHVDYDRAAIDTAAAPIEAALPHAPGEVVVIHGWHVWQPTDEPGYWRAEPGDGEGHAVYCYGREFCARQLAVRIACERARVAS